jgi:protein SSD1
MIQPQQHLPQGNQFQMQNMSPATGQQPFQFPQQQMGQHLQVPMNPSPQTAHRRNQSALPNVGMGPPPAPSSGASGFGDFNQQDRGRENQNPRGGRGGQGGGHSRRHSLALPEAKKAAELAEAKRKASGFSFPAAPAPGEQAAPGSSANRSISPASAGPQLQSESSFASRGRGGHGRSQSMAVGNGRGGGRGFQFPASGDTLQPGQNDFSRRGSHGHGRSNSRNFDGNWRQQNNQQAGQDNQSNFSMNQNVQAQPFQPGHRPRGSMNQSMGSIGNFQYGQQQPGMMQMPQGQMMMQPQMFGGQLNPMQLAQLQAQMSQMNMNGQQMGGLQGSQHAPQGMSMQQQQQQQRKTLFTPYLPQASLPALLSDGQLVAGILRVNKKNRSDAYVTTTDLDADIFICGSKDRNRALEGDLVAIELLDVDEVWGQKREKEEKKKRKDNNDRNPSIAVNDATTQPETQTGDGQIRRRGSLRQRPTQKKNDDVEVEGQSLLLMEEEEINDEQKPLYAGHVVAVIERVAGQMFSGTLGLLRPSSQATKEKQEAERQAREGNNRQPERQQDKPKIVWFKPTDKRVPLIAIPTEQAPRDFVERHQDYANRIFVACIKRWPITSLHPFGTLVEQLGEMGDLKVETDALLRDNNFGPDDFSDAVTKNVGFENWSVANDGEEALANRRDFRGEKTFTIDPTGSKELDDAIHLKDLGDGRIEVGIHVADVAHFIKPNSLVDREAKKRGTAVYLMTRTVNMLPPRLSTEICSLVPGEDRYTVSVVFNVDSKTGRVQDDQTWVGKAVIKSSGKLSYDDVNAVLAGDTSSVTSEQAADVKTLSDLTHKFRQVRFGDRSTDIRPLRLLDHLDDESVPVENNLFDTSAAREMIEELSYKANAHVAQKIFAGLPEKAFLRRQPSPNPRRLATFAERMNAIGYEIDTSSSGALQTSIFKIEDSDVNKGMQTLLVKAMQRAKYFVAGKTAESLHPHFSLNLPLYTHFCSPTRRYADIIVHRQLEAVLSEGAIEFQEDVESLAKTADTANTKKDSAHNAQEQSMHIEACRRMDKLREERGTELISEGIVLCVYESAFDVLIPEFGFEKRVHCDQLPLKKAEFDKNSRLLELFWEKGVPSSAYIPEDERPKAGSIRSANAMAAARDAEIARQRAKEQEEAQRRNMDTGTISTDDVDALFDDEEDGASEATEATAGVSLRQGGDAAPGAEAATTSSIAKNVANAPEAKLTNKEKYLNLFKLREENGDYIQDVREMYRVPVILKTDLSKSPPYVSFR